MAALLCFNFVSKAPASTPSKPPLQGIHPPKLTYVPNTDRLESAEFVLKEGTVVALFQNYAIASATADLDSETQLQRRLDLFLSKLPFSTASSKHYLVLGAADITPYPEKDGVRDGCLELESVDSSASQLNLRPTTNYCLALLRAKNLERYLRANPSFRSDEPVEASYDRSPFLEETNHQLENYLFTMTPLGPKRKELMRNLGIPSGFKHEDVLSQPELMERVRVNSGKYEAEMQEFRSVVLIARDCATIGCLKKNYVDHH